MKSNHLFFRTGLACLALAAAAHAAEPRNLDLLKAEIREYFKPGGDYERDLAAVAAKADAWLVERAAKRAAHERLAVVFDLDETLISGWSLIASIDFGYSVPMWEAWAGEGKAPPIVPVREVYRTARRLNIDVIFITGRRERLRAGTEKNLRDIGCGEWVAFIMKPDELSGPSAPYKTAARAKLVAQGYTIIANLGDQESDLVGGHAEKTFKLPNPIYLTP